MTGLSRQTSGQALHFCILNRYKARSNNVFCKQTADLFYKKFEIFWIFHLILCVQVCAGVRRSARVRLGMRRCVQVYSGVRGCAWVCAGMHGYAWVCARVCAQVCTRVCRCVWICTGVDMCVG